MSRKAILDVARQRPSFMEQLKLLPPYTVDDVTKAYEDRLRELNSTATQDAEASRMLSAAYERALDHARFQESRRVWMGGRVEVYQQRQIVINQVEQAGGDCILQPADSYEYEYGVDFAEILRKLVAVRLTGPHVTDDSMGWLIEPNASLGEIRLLDLAGATVTDAGIKGLAALTGLRCLDLRNTRVSMSGLDVLSALPALEWIHIGGTGVGSFAARRLTRTYPRLNVARRMDDLPPPFDGPEYEHMRLQRRLRDMGMLP